jgi:hypothetical protein
MVIEPNAVSSIFMSPSFASLKGPLGKSMRPIARSRKGRGAAGAQLAEHPPAIVDLVLTVIAVGAAIVAMVKCECRDCNEQRS